MAYIGRQNLGGAYRQLDDISSGFDGSDTTHTMQVNSANVTVGDVNQIILSLGGVIQKPGTDFTVSGSVLTFTTAPAANTSFFAVLLGSDNGGTVTPTDSSVTSAKLSGNLVTPGTLDLNGQELILDADADTSITADTDDQIDFKIAGSDKLSITSAGTLSLTSGNLEMDDTQEIRLGTGNDLVINFTGSDSVIDHTPGSGGLYIRADAILMQDSQSTPNQFVRMDQGSGVIFNDGSLDHDFRVESNGAEYALFVDGGNDVVMFGGTGSGSGTSTARSVMYSSGHIYQFVATNSTTDIQRFYNADTGSEIGSIEGASSSTAFRTSSDYRLKENVDYDWDATTRLKQLKPARFNWIVDDTNTPVDGFLAHEVSSIVPEAVGGEKDAVDDEGKIIPQGIDQSKLVPLMVKTIQELEARIKTLESA